MPRDYKRVLLEMAAQSSAADLATAGKG
jgi:hypothetical protein